MILLNYHLFTMFYTFKHKIIVKMWFYEISLRCVFFCNLKQVFAWNSILFSLDIHYKQMPGGLYVGSALVVGDMSLTIIALVLNLAVVISIR